jgi:DNA repair photolyase
MASVLSKSSNPDAVRADLRRGRAALSNPTARFERQTRVCRDAEWDYSSEAEWAVADDVVEEDVDRPAPPRTTVTLEACRTAIVRNQSPDIPFDRSINPYRGCEHGCIYCFARPTHAYSGLSSGLDFETKLFAKPAVVEKLKDELAQPGYRCRMIALGTNTDCYQPIEREHRLMRGILSVLHDCNHPVGIVTKAHLVTRDIDLLAAMAKKNLAHVFVSVTTLDRHLARSMEPRASTPARRLDAIRLLAEAGVPTGVMVAPIVPGLTDHELENILTAAADAGAVRAGYLVMRLPHEIKDLFREWLEENAPERASRIMSQIHQLRGGRDNDPRFFTRLTGEGENARLLAQRFDIARRKLGLNAKEFTLDASQFQPPYRPGQQITLF